MKKKKEVNHKQQSLKGISEVQTINKGGWGNNNNDGKGENMDDGSKDSNTRAGEGCAIMQWCMDL